MNGTLQLSALSGNSGDTEAVLAVGRDEDSGTRIQALACSGIGIQTFLPVTGQIASDLINSSAAVSGILLSAMHVSRDKDGARIELGGKPGN